MELNSELEVRQEIMTRLESIFVVMDGLIGVAIERNYNWREGQGYQLNITKNDFREIKINFESLYNLRLLLSKEQTTNYENWQEMITMVYSLVRLFKESKILFLTSFETTSGEITRLRDRIKKYVIEHNLDPVKNSAQYKTVKEKLSLKQLCELALKENDIYLEDDLDDLDFTGKKEFILYTFVSAKYEVAVNGINKKFAEFIKMNPDKIPHLDDVGWMLETMRNDDVITQDQFDEFEAYYEDVISLVDDVQELKIITNNNKPLTIKESELMTTPFEITTVGGVIYSRLEGMDYYYLVLTGAPSYHYGLLLLEEEISNEDIINNLTLIHLEGYSVGFRYRNKEDYWDKGEQIKQKYLSATLLPAEEINGKQFKILFK